MERKRSLKTAFLIAGSILISGGILWASVIGYYQKDIPVLFAFLLGGLACLYASSKMGRETDTSEKAFNEHFSKKKVVPTPDEKRAGAAVGKWQCECGRSNDFNANFCDACGRERPGSRP